MIKTIALIDLIIYHSNEHLISANNTKQCSKHIVCIILFSPNKPMMKQLFGILYVY